MKEVDVALSRCAATQHGIVHHRQAQALGMTPRQIQTRLAAGLLVAVHQGVYRLAGVAPSPEQGLLAACLAGGAGAVVWHRGGAWLWRLRGFGDPLAEITVPIGQPSLRGVVVHRTRTLDPVDVTRTRRVAVTTPARTLLNLGAVVGAEEVEPALEDALLRRLVTVELLAATLGRLGGPGRQGSATLRALLAERDPGVAATESVLEDEFLRLLRRAGLPEPVRQYRVGRVRLDFAYPDRRLGIEVDGLAWHTGRADLQRNVDKANVLVAHGWSVLHFTAHDIRGRPAHVVEGVAAAWAA